MSKKYIVYTMPNNVGGSQSNKCPLIISEISINEMMEVHNMLFVQYITAVKLIGGSNGIMPCCTI